MGSSGILIKYAIRFLALLLLIHGLYAADPENRNSDSSLLINEAKLEQINAELSAIRDQSFIFGQTFDHTVKLQFVKNEAEALYASIAKISGASKANQTIMEGQKERLYRISKLSFGLFMSKAWIIPFFLLLLIIAFGPLIIPGWWEKNFNKSLVSLILSLPVILLFIQTDYRHLLHTGKEYLSFIILIGSLFIISGGIYLHGSIKASPFRNTLFLVFGAVLTNFIGTTGTAMVLFRPFVRTNKQRSNRIHLVLFFIFIVCNIGGLLTPLGDPPLFLGFIRGVPFQWPLHMFPQWLFVNSVLLSLFFSVDFILFKKEAKRPSTEEALPSALSFHGKINFLFLAGIVACAFLSGYYHLPFGLQEAGMILMTTLSLLCSPLTSYERRENAFTFKPFLEVAVLFAGIFATMIPCLILLETWGQQLHIASPAQFFWASGFISQFLDNAPTYLTFSALASALAGTDANLLSQLALHPQGMLNLTAISCGSVFFGANTYIGNAPNFMVKALAEEHGIRMPSFFGYMLWSTVILFPVYLLCTKIFFQ